MDPVGKCSAFFGQITALSLKHQSKRAPTIRRMLTTKWFVGSFVLRMRCYASGWVALALPVWTGLFQDFSGSHETSAYTGRASATQP